MIAVENERLELVRRLLACAQPLHATLSALSAIGWDYEGLPVLLTEEHIAAVLRRFLTGNLSAMDVETWANGVEGRDDIATAPASEHRMTEIVHELANPALHHPLAPARARALLAELAAS
ncbi:hypothetical protein H3H37_03340 [Duganella sp. LX20W]|uniref:Uncharacterized protein n=1 Tax=Rugamonas brunnea TaxID=2758569 RepID=A0A7W2EP85_9BURK|nr:hypothetical protein [Rugamonas brunnea]MBA5636082.1 hypothetical protein [Rugamonas brunnea]